MPRATRHYRLRIRSADDASDALILTSVPGGTNPYLTGPPQGDGQQIDPATGESSIGAYTIEAADVSEIVTAALVDGNGRQTLIQRRAYLELSVDGGSSWPTVLVPGFVNAYRLVTPMRWAFTIGESRRIEYTRKVWDRTTDNFEQATCLIGGPIKDGWGPIVDYGSWRFEVTESDADTVTLAFKDGYLPIDASTPGYVHVVPMEDGLGALTPYARSRANQLATAEEALTGTDPDTSGYLGIVVLVQAVGGVDLDRFTPVAQLGPLGSLPRTFLTWNDEIKLLRAGTVWAGSPPSNGTIYRLYAWRTTIGEDNPLHIQKHPIDILTDLWDDAGIAYDSTEAATVRGLVGDNTRVRLRIIEPWTLRDVVQMIGGLYGVGTRVGTDGELELIRVRIRDTTAPSSLYDDDDLRSPDTVIFEVDESSIYNTITVEQLRFRRWGSGMGERAADDITVASYVRSKDLDSEGGGTPDSETFGVRELRFTVPGEVTTDASGHVLGDVYFEKGLAGEIFDRFGRGGVYCTIAALPTITEKVGQEFRLDVSHLPNAGVRGGERILQIVRRTETPSGPELLLLDSGPNSQFATAPTFTLAAGAADARKYVDVTITNAAALNTAGAWLRIEWGVAGSEPSSGSLLTQYMAGEIPSSFTTPAVDAGSHVWMRMQTFIPNKRPTAYTAWQSVDLTDLTAPSSLSQSAGSDPARITITFTAGESDIPLEVLQRPQGDPANEARVVDSLSPGSDRVTLTLDPGSSYTIGIRHRELADFAGVSSTTEITFTVAGSPDTLPAPTKPFVLGIKWSVGSIGGIFPDGAEDRYAVGLRVRSAIDDGFLEFDMATETSVGSGTPGSYSLMERRSVTGVDETYIFTIGVPLDGKLRYLRARHVRSGAIASSYTSVLSVMPGDIVSPPPPVDPGEITGVVPVTLGGTEIADPTTGVLLVGAGSSAMTQLAPGAAGGYVRSGGSAWARSSGVAAADLSGTIPSARLSGVYSGITGLGTQAQALDMGTNNITGVANITASAKFISTGGGEEGCFHTGAAGNTVFAFSGDNWDVRAGTGGSASQNVLRVTSDGAFDFYGGNISNVGTYSGGAITASGVITVSLSSGDQALIIDNRAGETDYTPLIEFVQDSYGNPYIFAQSGELKIGRRGVGPVITFMDTSGNTSFGSNSVSMGALTTSGIVQMNSQTNFVGASNAMLAPFNITGDAANIGDRHEAIWMRSKSGGFIVQINTNGAQLEIGGGAPLDTTPVAIFNYLTNAVTFSGDVQIGSLGIFDSSDTPTGQQLLIYNDGVGKWQAEDIQLAWGGSDIKAAVLADNTAVTFIIADPGSGADSPGGAPPIPSAPTLYGSHESITIEVSYSRPADFRYFQWRYSDDNFSSDNNALATTTSDKIVHARLDNTTTYYYKVRATDRAGNSSSYSSVSSTAPTANGAQAFGIILAAEIGVANLAAIQADIGIITAGQMRDVTNTYGINLGSAGGIPGGWNAGINFENTAVDTMDRYVNFYEGGSNGLDSFIKHEKFDLKHDGTAIFNGQLDITSAQLPQSLQDFHLILRDPDVSHGMTNVVETDVFAAIGYTDPSNGGLSLHGFLDNVTGRVTQLTGTIGAASSTSVGIVSIQAWKKSGTGRIAIADTDMLCDFTAGLTQKVKIFGDGDIVTVGSITAVGLALSGSLEIDGDLNHDGTKIGFYGATPVTRGVVSGSGLAALANLIFELDEMGLITDNTT